MKTRNKWLTAGLGLALGAVVVVWVNMASIEAEGAAGRPPAFPRRLKPQLLSLKFSGS
ncbi:MAG: hypothetical protein IH999_02155 [Proteobacteria bacterium]|nr:hypothetical protein [Pseudomonadota bacterium]